MPWSHEAVLLEPSFTYHGFRYAQVNFTSAPTTITAREKNQGQDQERRQGAVACMHA